MLNSHKQPVRSPTRKASYHIMRPNWIAQQSDSIGQYKKIKNIIDLLTAEFTESVY